jgi:surface antigen
METTCTQNVAGNMKKLAIVVLALFVVGCTKSQMDQAKQVTPMQIVGIVVGAAAGGVIGAQLGGGLGKSFMIASGIMAGGAVGYVAARKLEMSDRNAHDKSASQAFAKTADGTTSYWKNPETGSSGIIVPTRSYHAGDGSYCRDYRTTVAVKEDFIRGRGIGCQEASGDWKIKMEELG